MLELLPGKKPRTKVPLADSRVWLVLRICDAVKVSVEVEIVVKKVWEVMMNQKRKRQERSVIKVKPRMFAEQT